MAEWGPHKAFGRLSDGAVSERPKVQLSKSCVVQATVGSNPTRSAARYTAGAGRNPYLGANPARNPDLRGAGFEK